LARVGMDDVLIYSDGRVYSKSVIDSHKKWNIFTNPKTSDETFYYIH